MAGARHWPRRRSAYAGGDGRHIAPVPMGNGRWLQMTASSPSRPSPSPPSTTARLSGSPRRELTLLILLGAAGAGLVLLAMRQAWAHIVTAAPKPLPASV